MLARLKPARISEIHGPSKRGLNPESAWRDAFIRTDAPLSAVFSQRETSLIQIELVLQPAQHVVRDAGLLPQA